MRVNPQKAQDLSGLVDWRSSDPFRGIAAYLTDDYAAEPKIDGCRVQLTLGDTHNTVATGNGTYNGQFPHLRDATVPELAGTVIDGELVWNGGMPTSLMTSNPAKAVRNQRLLGNAEFYAFDILAVVGDDVTALPYDDRRVMLESAMDIVSASGHGINFRLVEQFPATAETIQECLDRGLEGVMLKRRTAAVEAGKRSASWLKVKRTMTGDFFVVGSKAGKGGCTGKVGALTVAWWDPTSPDSYRVCGSVAGFTYAERDQVTDPATGLVRSSLIGSVIEVAAQEVTTGGWLRHPRFVRFRPDKAADECGAEQIEGFRAMSQGSKV